MLFEINFSQETAIGLHERVDLVRDLAFVKSVPTFFADQAQRLCERGIFENITLRRSAALPIERVSFEKRAGDSFIQARAKRPVIRDQFRDWKTSLGISNRRRKVVVQFQFPEFFLQLRPCVHCSRHADWQHADRWNRLAMQFRQLGLHLIITQTGRRTSAPIDSVKFVFLRAVNDCEKIAANSIRDWFH